MMGSAAPRVLLVGCGNMGGAMLRGWLAGGFSPDGFTAFDPRLEEAPAGVRLLRELPVGETFDAILLGMKPQGLGEAAPQIAPLAGAGAIVLSMLAGVELATLAGHFPGAGAIVRVMPNLAVALGKSPVGLFAEELSAGQRETVDRLMAPLGQPEWLANEAILHGFTALAGSGPGFVYRFLDALGAGGEALGLPAEQAARIALAMVEGAVALAAQAGESPATLARRVASPGGTTEAGLAVLDHEGAMAQLVAKTLRAASDRSEEMARS
ncbi:pyrroline-5-carboxylate reductase family protein [Novosphingobium tardum]